MNAIADSGRSPVASPVPVSPVRSRNPRYHVFGLLRLAPHATWEHLTDDGPVSAPSREAAIEKVAGKKGKGGGRTYLVIQEKELQPFTHREERHFVIEPGMPTADDDFPSDN